MTASVKVSKMAVRRFLLTKQKLWSTGDYNNPVNMGNQKRTKRTRGHSTSFDPCAANANAKPNLNPNPDADSHTDADSNHCIDTDVLRLVQDLECIQIDPVAAVARNQHLVLAARMQGYVPQALEHLISKGQLFEYFANAACLIPMADYPIFELTRQRIREQLQTELSQLSEVVNQVLKRLEQEGPLPSKAFASTKRVHGYWDNRDPKTKATSHALNLLNDTGQIQVVHREGTTRYFDLAERAVPRDLLSQAHAIDLHEAAQALSLKYMRAYRVFDPGDSRFGWQHMPIGERRQVIQQGLQDGSITQLEMEDIKRPYYVLSEDLEELRNIEDQCAESHSPITFLPPLDNLLWRRDRVADLFGFNYTWEIYIPAVKRQFGYYTMPILAGGRFIGRIDPRLNRQQGELIIKLLQIEPRVRWTKTLRRQLLRALEDFAGFHQAKLGNVEVILPEGREL